MDIFKLFGTIAINNAGANKAIRETTDEAKEAGSKIQKVGEGFKKVGSGMSNVGKGMLPISAGIGGIAAMGVKTAAGFESSMSKVAATMGMTSEEINNGSESYKRLEQAARDMGKKTKYSAGEAAEALNYMALAGYDVDKSINTLPTVLNLAAAGDIDLASASDMVTDAMSALGEKAGTTEEFVDKMAKTSQKSNTSVAQLGEAILTVGGTAKKLKNGTTELNTALGILADNGVKGAEGGTALRNIILSLSAPTDQASKLMKNLGLEVYDADGNMRPLNDTFKDLDKILGTMNEEEKTEVLNTIFNKVDLKSADALLSNCGDRFDELSGMIDNANGAAQTMADTMQNNLNGQITTLKSMMEEAAISIGKVLLPVVKKIVEKIQKAADWFNSLSDSQKSFVVKIALIVAAIGPALIIFGKLTSSVGDLVTAIPKIGGAFKTMWTGVSKVFALMMAHPFIALAAGIAMLVTGLIVLYQTNEDFRNKVNAIWEGIKNFFIAIWDTIVAIFKAVIDGIVNDFNSMVSDITNAWNTGVAIVTAIWEGLKIAAEAIFEAIKWAITKPFEVARDFLVNSVNAIRDTFVNTFNGIADFVRGIIDRIKGFFNFKWALPHIKLPHFKVSGSINPIDWIKDGPPHIGVDWYAKGGIMTQPTMFGFDQFTGNAMVGGEAGPEAILPISNLKTYVSEAVIDQNKALVNSIDSKFEKLFEILSVYFPQFTKPLILDTGEVVSKLAPGMDAALGELQARRDRQ
ncbi:MAG: phage tail tape measure protein [Clostridiales bacterium]|nr:phage tail tape measure protein [Clostridiales bacterium]MDU1042721.1 phage tail tape measure protein [Clostridiales bacterium]MDU3490452.1 phage tail tape measure protein [Clostridiales bacterium]